jgi:hypothetical protein
LIYLLYFLFKKNKRYYKGKKMTTLYPGMTVPKIYTKGLGYSPASGPQVGGLDISANPYVYSSTFFGSDVKGLLPPIVNFSKKRTKKRTKKRYNIRSRKQSHKRKQRKNRRSRSRRSRRSRSKLRI